MFGFHNCSEDKKTKPSLAFDTVWDSPLKNPSYNTGHCCAVKHNCRLKQPYLHVSIPTLTTLRCWEMLQKKYESRKLVVVPTLDDNTGPKNPVRFFLNQKQERKKCVLPSSYIPLKWLFLEVSKAERHLKTLTSKRWLEITHFSFGVGRV